jgi:4-hydroxyacetophenone monooxygenase
MVAGMSPSAPPLADDAALEQAVHAANLPTLLLMLVQLTGSAELMRGAIRPRRATAQRPDGGLDASEAAQVREQALLALRAHRSGRAAAWPCPPAELLHEMMSFSLGQAVPAEYVPMMAEELGFVPDAPASAPLQGAHDLHVLVVGAGMSGLLAAIELRKLGVRVSVIEKNPELGGTWFENSYPGCRVDLPSHFYSYSFARNADWSAYYARRDELLAYFRRVADEHAVRALIRFNTELVSADFDAERNVWRAQIKNHTGNTETLEANVLISAVGQLNRPSIPALPGLASFAGPSFHSANWRHDVDLAGKRVGIVGTGASAMQIVPELAKQAAQVVIFQRAAQWAVPVPDYFREVSADERWALRHLPFYAAWYRFRQFYINADGNHASLQVDPSWPHPERSVNANNDRLRQTLTDYIERELGARKDELLPHVLPDYPPFAKRMLIDNRWFHTLTRDNVQLVSAPIANISERGVELSSGEEHELDVLVFATGFHANRFLWPMRITGAQGTTLEQHWGDEPRAHLGIGVPGFPNLFLLYGPNTNLAHGGSIIFHSECQVRYIRACLELMLREGHAAMDVLPAAHDAYNARVDAAHAQMVWTRPNVHNWFRNARGRVVTHSPFRLVDYWTMTRALDPADYRFFP